MSWDAALQVTLHLWWLWAYLVVGLLLVVPIQVMVLRVAKEADEILAREEGQ